MSFRKRKNDSDEDSDEERLPIRRDDDDEEDDPMDGPSASKKSRNVWSDLLLEQQLLEKGQGIQLEKKNAERSSRGLEFYPGPEEEFPKNKRMNRKKRNQDHGSRERPVVVVTPADDDPFGDVPIAPAEEFGIKKSTPIVMKNEGFWSTPGHARQFNFQSNEKKKNVPKQTAQLLAEEYSLEAMLSTEFDENVPIEELGQKMAHAMGEKDPETVQKVVSAIGARISIKLFNETKEIEKNGGMKTADGSRRRTPGGVFITLFKMDSDVSRQVKNSIFGVMKQTEKERMKNRKRGREFTKKLEEMKQMMDLAAKEEERKVDEELRVNQCGVFDDDQISEIV